MTTTVSPEVTVDRLLALVCSELGMDTAFIGRLSENRRAICYVSGSGLAAGDSDAADESYCQLIVDGEISPVIPDAQAHPRLRDMEVTKRLGIGSYVGLPLRLSDGTLYGTLCAYGSAASPHLVDSDLRVLNLVAALVADRLEDDVRLERTRAEELAVIAEQLAAGQPSMVFQPIVDLTTGTTVGYEALARFATVPYRTPDVWMADAARAGLGVELELQAIANAIDASAGLPAGCYLAVNVGPSTLASEQLVSVLAAADRPVVVELTEHERTSQPDLRRHVARLQAAGYRVAMDDVGAGESGLSRLLALRPDVVKLDRDLVAGLDADIVRRALVAAAVSFAAAAGGELVAEGVETEPESVALKALGIRCAQGYLFGRPAPALPQPVLRIASGS